MTFRKLLSFLALLAPTVLFAQAPPFPQAAQSFTASRFVAANYGQWQLQIYSVPSGTGSQTMLMVAASVRLPDGRGIMPFNTNAPIKVGTEIVTPTAVSGCTYGNPAVGVCQITATFTLSHSTSDAVSSGTYGLQEALNDASLAGGGAVSIDASWASLGGTTAIKNAATIPTNVGIEDVRTGVPSGGGATFNPSSIQFATSTTAARAATPSDISTLLATLASCTSGTVYAPVTNTCVANGGGGSLPSGAAFNTPVYLTPGTTVTPLYNGNGIDATSGAIQDSVGARTTQFGMDMFGDSKDAGTGGGCTSSVNLDLCFPFRLNADVNQGQRTNYAQSGDACSDISYWVALKENPSDFGNPLFVGECGTNDLALHASGWPTGSQAQLTQYWYAIMGNTGLSSTSKINAQNAAIVTTGTWANDSTFTANPGITTTSNGATATYSSCYVGPTGVLGMHFYQYGTSDATYSVTLTDISTTALTDQITGLTAIPAQYIASFAPIHIGTTTEAAARFTFEGGTSTTIPPGLHTCKLTVALTSGPAGFVDFFMPAAARTGGTGSPFLVLGNISPELNNAEGTLLNTLNGWVANAISLGYGDGLAVKMANVFAHIDPIADLQDSATVQCPLPGLTTLHWNQCGQVHAAQAYEEAIQISTGGAASSNFPSTANGFQFNPNHCQGTSTTQCPAMVFYNNTNGVSFSMFGNLANTANGAPAAAASSFSQMFTAAATGFSSGFTFCTNATTYPSTSIANTTCGIDIRANNLNIWPLIAATSGSSRPSQAINFIGSGWNTGGTAAASNNYAITNTPTSNGSASNFFLQIKQTANSGTGQNGISIQNSSGFGAQYRTDLATALTSGFPGFGLPVPAVAPTYSAATGCSAPTAVGTNTNTRGSLSIVCTTATTGVIGTVTFSATETITPHCTPIETAFTTPHGLSVTSASATAFSISAAVTVASTTVTLDYVCLP